MLSTQLALITYETVCIIHFKRCQKCAIYKMSSLFFYRYLIKLLFLLKLSSQEAL